MCEFQVDLYGNPWDCSCYVEELKHHMLDRYRYRRQLRYEQTQCATPEMFAGAVIYRSIINNRHIYTQKLRVTAEMWIAGTKAKAESIQKFQICKIFCFGIHAFPFSKCQCWTKSMPSDVQDCRNYTRDSSNLIMPGFMYVQNTGYSSSIALLLRFFHWNDRLLKSNKKLFSVFWVPFLFGIRTYWFYLFLNTPLFLLLPGILTLLYNIFL